jgi:anti-anti-sigma regulatory factor
MDTAASVELRAKLVAAANEDIVFDGAAVEMIGAQCLELLMSCGVIWNKADRSISIENVSPQMLDDLSRFGLTPDTLLEYAA